MILFHSYSNEEKEGSFGSKNVSALLHAMQCKELLLFGLSSLFYSRKWTIKVCKIKDLCGIVMLSEKHNILEFNHYVKSGK